MASLVRGIHHITVCAGGAQEDADFFTQVVGERLIKQTVLFDGRYAHYHLYYGPVLSIRELAEQERFLTEALGFRKTGSEGPYHRFEVGEGGPAKTLILQQGRIRARRRAQGPAASSQFSR